MGNIINPSEKPWYTVVSGITLAGPTKTYETYADMLREQYPGKLAWVKDASGDPTVDEGSAMYVWREHRGWVKLYETEMMDEGDKSQAIARNFIGWVENPDKLNELYPTGKDGMFAIVGTTDSVWVWDSDTQSWVDSHSRDIEVSHKWDQIEGKPEYFPSTTELVIDQNSKKSVTTMLSEIQTNASSLTDKVNEISITINNLQITDIVGLPETISKLSSVAFSGSYVDLLNVPLEFPPSSHSHTWSEITDKPDFEEQHTHENMDVISSLSDTDGKLMYNGELVGIVTKSTPEQIDASVEIAHSHPNKSDIDRLGVTSDSQLTIDGLVFDLPETGIPCILQSVDTGVKNGTCILLRRNAENSGWEPYGDATSCWLWWEGETEFPMNGLTGYAPLREDHWENVVKELGVNPSDSSGNGIVFENDDKFGKVVRCGESKYFDDGLERHVYLGPDRLWFPPNTTHNKYDYLTTYTYSIWVKPLVFKECGITNFWIQRNYYVTYGGGMYLDYTSTPVGGTGGWTLVPTWLFWSRKSEWGAHAGGSGVGNRWPDVYYIKTYNPDSPPWLMCTISVGGGFTSFYVNGQLGFQYGSQTSDIGVLTDRAINYNGASSTNMVLAHNWSRELKGHALFANAVGYNRALSAQEVLKLYNYQNNAKIPGVVTQPSLPKVGQAGVLVGDVFIPIEDVATTESLTLLQDTINENKNRISELSATVNGYTADIAGKVDKVEGKQLSTEDYTTEEKTKLNDLSNYDDSELKSSLNELKAETESHIEANSEHLNESTIYCARVISINESSSTATVQMQVKNGGTWVDDISKSPIDVNYINKPMIDDKVLIVGNFISTYASNTPSFR